MQELPTIIKDSREKEGHGFHFRKSDNCDGMIVEKLDYGDYAIKDYDRIVIIERKQNVVELCGNIGKYRERFESELQRMVDANVLRKYIVIEDYWSSVVKKQRYSRMHPNSIFESIIALQVKYDIPFLFCGTHEMSQRVTRSILLKTWKYYKEGKLC